MGQFVEEKPRSLWGRILSQPYLLLAVILLIILAIPSFQRGPQDWEMVYVPAAARLARGEDILQHGFVYPPINAWLPLPFVGLSHVPTRALWFAINMISLGVVIVGAWRLSGGGRLNGKPSVPGREHLVFWLGLACGISSCFDTITNQQTDLIVAALVILGCIALTGQRDIRAALWFGAAAAIKCTPLLWAPYLAWRRKWAAALLVVLAAGALNLIPDIAYPSVDRPNRLTDWVTRYMMPMANRKHDFGTWACGLGGNQSVAGLWHRWLLYDPVWHDNELVGQIAQDRVAPETLKAVTSSSLLLFLVAGIACAWKVPPNPSSSQDPNHSPSEMGLQFGMILILMVLLSPHSSKPHFCTLVLPGFCVARGALYAPNRRLLLAVLVPAVIGALLANSDLAGSWLYSWGKWYGSLAWCAIFLFAGACWMLVRNRQTLSVPVERDQAPASGALGRAA